MPRAALALLCLAACHAPAPERSGAWVQCAPFTRLILSWNIDAPSGAAFIVEAKVRGPKVPASPWMHLGDFGAVPETARGASAWDAGEVDVDTLQALPGVRFDAWRWRVRAVDPEFASAIRPARIDAIADRPGAFTAPGFVTGASTARAVSRHTVPARSQRSEEPRIAHRICSPTCVAMVLEAFGRDLSTADVAAAIYDPWHDLFGVWPRAVQYAYSQGITGRLEALRDWQQVEERLEDGALLVLSVGYERGALRGAPLESTAGHLIVLTGFDSLGRALVHDPAAPDAASVPRRYLREDLEEVWMRRGAVAYVFDPPQNP